MGTNTAITKASCDFSANTLPLLRQRSNCCKAIQPAAASNPIPM